MAAAGDPARCPYGHADTVKLLSTVALGGRAGGGRAPMPAAPAGRWRLLRGRLLRLTAGHSAGDRGRRTESRHTRARDRAATSPRSPITAAVTGSASGAAGAVDQRTRAPNLRDAE